MNKKLLLINFLIFLSFTGFGQEKTPEKVLFVGNSYTYFWNLPQTVNLMAEAKGIEMSAKQTTAGGSNLGQHWRGEKGLNSVNMIKKGKFDAIILQDHSMRSILAPDSLMHYGKLLGELIKKKKAKPYLYMTWAREWNPLMQATITEAYIDLAKEINAEIIPVGLAWKLAKELRPNIDLYDPDGSHPSSLGTYLTGCVFFGVLTGESPVGLPPRLHTTDANGEKLYISINNQNDAIFCQQVAEKTIERFRKQRK